MERFKDVGQSLIRIDRVMKSVESWKCRLYVGLLDCWKRWMKNELKEHETREIPRIIYRKLKNREIYQN